MKKEILLFIFIFFSVLGFTQENCNNGVDDDGDGKIDLNDNECICINSNPVSLINNYNFEQKNFCPNDWAQFNAASNWFLPSTATSDYINSCDFVPASATDAGIYPLPAQNGNGVSGVLVAQDYKEFIAICTNTTLTAGTQYQLNFNIASSTSGRIVSTQPNIGQVCNDGVLNAARLNITVYGKSNCDTNAPPNSNNFPPGWQPLGSISYLPSKNWGDLSILFTPSTNINSIMLGGPYTLPSTYVEEYDYHSCFPYLYFDNIILNTSSILGLSLNSTGVFCENSLVLNAVIDSSNGSSFSYQWYKEGIAIVGATNSSLNVNYSATNIGNYQVKITNSNFCKISPIYNVNNVIDVPEFIVNQSPCFPGNATVTITTPADEYSFDNGQTWSTNPSKSNISPSYPTMILIRKNGCVSNTRYVVLDYAPIETISQPELIVVQPGCQTNGSITVTTPALEYSFDDGVTWTNNSVLSNLPPNSNYTYKVRIRTLLGCVTNARYVTMHPFFLPEATFTYTNSSCGNGGSITITTPAMEYSINGGNTWSTNPVFTGLAAGSYPIRIKNSLNCISIIKFAFIGNDFLPKPDVVYTQPTCGVLGTITVTTIAAAYSFDNGVTWTTNNTAINLMPGFYHVKIKDAQNCVSLSQLVYLESYILNVNVTYTAQNASCSNNGSITINANALEFSFDDGVTWSNNPTATNLAAGFYFIKVRNGNYCESLATVVHILDFTNTTPNFQVINADCNQYGSVTITTIADLYSFDNGVTWSTNNSITNLSGNYNFDLVVKNGISCISQSVHVNFNSNYASNPIANNYNALVCDSVNDNTETVNLATYNSFLISNSNNYTFHYFTSITDAQNLNLTNEIQNAANYQISNSNNSIFVSVVSSDNCLSVVEITFTLLASPIITSIPDTLILCENSSITVNGGNTFDNYLWSTGATISSTSINQPGNYSLTASYDYGNQICSSTKNFTVVLSNAAMITGILTQDFTTNDNAITVNATGFGDYEYSIDGINYQNSNTFTNLASGIYTVYIRDKNGCGIITEDVFLLMYPQFFTPNNDGSNDTWKIKFSNFEPNLKVSIFDRYGKFIKELNSTNSWDGKYNGLELPADDYWFVVTRTNGKEFRNHFALKR